MSEIWNKLIECQDSIIDMFDEYGKEYSEDGLDYFNQPDNGWINRVWQNDNIRRAHIDVVDARDSKGLWMMHVCIFPQLHNNGPIYGFDVIAGKNKMTGAFHDFSPLGGPNGDGVNHNMVEWFEDTVSEYVPSKKRELPEWALNIFSGSMIAAGNVTDIHEATTIVELATNNLKVYLECIGYNWPLFFFKGVSIKTFSHCILLLKLCHIMLPIKRNSVCIPSCLYFFSNCNF